MATQIEDAALAYAQATQAVIRARDVVMKFKQDMERAAFSAPMLGHRFALTGDLKEALMAQLQKALFEAIDKQTDASRRLDSVAGIKGPSL